MIGDPQAEVSAIGLNCQHRLKQRALDDDEFVDPRFQPDCLVQVFAERENKTWRSGRGCQLQINLKMLGPVECIEDIGFRGVCLWSTAAIGMPTRLNVLGEQKFAIVFIWIGEFPG